MFKLSKCKLASFDLDGTLVPDISSGGFLAEKLGHAEAMHQAEQRYATGQVANDYVSTFDAQHYQGLSKADVFKWLDDIPQIAHITDTVKTLNEYGVPSVICTLAWKCVAEYFAHQHGFTAFSGPVLEENTQGQFTGRVASHFDEFGKPVFIRQLCRQMNITMEEVVHIGDSRSDIELFKQVGHSIAINATPDALAVAQCSIKTTSLLDVVPLIVDRAELTH